ncbi:MAG: NADH:ubiquinone reductase (Na(+)-transporting) subunit C [Bacteroidales bacterium]
MFSNKYIFVYTAVLVTVVAAVLSTAAILLQPMQTKNVEIEKMQNILRSADIESTSDNAVSLYEQYITEELLVNAQGNVCDVYTQGRMQEGNLRAFDVNLKDELAKPKDQALFPVFICQNNTEKMYVVPLQGKGLWGPIWGYLALKADLNTIIGVTLDHKGETPGLGAEIADPKFQSFFKGKEIFNTNGEFVSVVLVKGGVKNGNISVQHAVDAISGGTITSNGVTDMLKTCLSNYENYFQKLKQQIETDLSSTDSVSLNDSVQLNAVIEASIVE